MKILDNTTYLLPIYLTCGAVFHNLLLQADSTYIIL